MLYNVHISFVEFLLFGKTVVFFNKKLKDLENSSYVMANIWSMIGIAFSWDSIKK